jgi:hypothetical protein
MSRHRRRTRHEGSSQNSSGFNLNNLDLSSIAGIINNIDMNQVSAFLNNAVNNGGDIEKDEKNNQIPDSNTSNAESRKSELIRALRTLINADKSEVLQIVIQLYASARNNK